MNDAHREIERTLTALASEDSETRSLWARLEGLGLTAVALREDAGGGGGDDADAVFVAGAAARLGLDVPLAESNLMAAWALEAASLPMPAGMVSAALDAPDLEIIENDHGWRVRGTVQNVPYGATADALVLAAVSGPQTFVVVAGREGLTAVPAPTLGTARADLEIDGVFAADSVRAAPGVDAASAHRRGALARSVQIAGALDGVLTMTVAYVNEREQFGRPLARFQVVQHQVAELAAEVEAVRAATAAAALRAHSSFAVGVARARAGRAVERGAAIAHQLHGALGFTDEHRLHLLTTRLWTWREEYGTEFEWADEIGASVLSDGADDAWSWLVSHQSESTGLSLDEQDIP